jgi:hypothetical protein
MRLNRSTQWTRTLAALSAGLLIGCGTIHHTARFDPEFDPEPGTKVEVGEVSNETGETYDIDVAQMFRDALLGALEDEDLLATRPGEHLIVNARIVEYDRGNAFKRWLLPGWGTTVLAVEAEVETVSNDVGGLPQVAAAAVAASPPSEAESVGHVDARRTVAMGGAYTIGAWKSIMGDVAEDVVDELEEEL